MILVFGSNLAGAHGAGAARDALLKYGAVMGVGIGLRGQSYAIPTKDGNIRTLPLIIVSKFISDFIEFAAGNPKLKFKVTQVGCGLAGFTAKEIAPLFKAAPKNCYFDLVWGPYLGEDKNYWGTF